MDGFDTISVQVPVDSGIQVLHGDSDMVEVVELQGKLEANCQDWALRVGGSNLNSHMKMREMCGVGSLRA